jgi:hypothetical protein
MPSFGGEQLHMLHNRYETYIAYTNLPEKSKIQEHVCYESVQAWPILHDIDYMILKQKLVFMN